MSKYKFINPRNVELLVPIGPKAMRILDEGLAAWDRDTGIPSRIVAYNAAHGQVGPSETGQNLGGHIVGLYSMNGATHLGVQPDNAPTEEGRTSQPTMVIEPSNTVNGATTRFELALRYLLKGYTYAGGHTVYQHAVETPNGEAWLYYGITKRNWAVRWGEHLADAKHGSNLLFHRALREKLIPGGRIFHVVCVAGVSEDDALDLEEYLVAKRSLFPGHPNGLNMIPGGRAGILWLHKLGALSGQRPTVEQRDSALRKWVDANPRKGVPNPLVAQAWARDGYAEAVICGAPGRLSRGQVLGIRALAGRASPEAIAASVGARNALQVDRVLRGATYSRVAA